ncbi:MAG: class B sortase [Roseburia sp.]|nr:class B sortase [Roseburia sp.]MCM1202057.1 class B sortase [Bacteroides fragilis]
MNGKRRKKTACFLGFLLLTACFLGCGASGQLKEEVEPEEDSAGEETEKGTGQAAEPETEAGMNAGDITEESGIFGESAADGHVDFGLLQEKNPDIFAWLYIPGTGIDLPVLQSHLSDDYYITHNVLEEEDGIGALYTEMPNLMDMCDFNTIIHGNDLEEGAPFKELHLFEDADFFEEYEEFYLYLPDNVLTYEIFVAYYDEGSDILRRHDYTTYAGCQEHLNEIYGVRSMNRNFREGWEGLTPYHFLVTLDGAVRENGTQYIVIGALKEDAAGKIDRMLYE